MRISDWSSDVCSSDLFGGPGWNEIERYIFAAECARAGAPHLAPMGLKMVAPVIMHYGSPEQRAHYLPRILSGEDYWCQGFSEPGAGADLAARPLRAAGDETEERRAGNGGVGSVKIRWVL